MWAHDRIPRASQKNALSELVCQAEARRTSASEGWPAKPKLVGHQRAKAGGRPTCGLPDAQADVRRGYVSSRRMRKERSCPSSEQARCHASIARFLPRI